MERGSTEVILIKNLLLGRQVFDLERLFVYYSEYEDTSQEKLLSHDWEFGKGRELDVQKFPYGDRW